VALTKDLLQYSSANVPRTAAGDAKDEHTFYSCTMFAHATGVSNALATSVTCSDFIIVPQYMAAAESHFKWNTLYYIIPFSHGVETQLRTT
jgi:hypothetical protein